MNKFRSLIYILAFVLVPSACSTQPTWIKQPIKVELKDSSISVVSPLCPFNKLSLSSESQVEVACYRNKVWSQWFYLSDDNALESEEPWSRLRVRKSNNGTSNVDLSADFLGSCVKKGEDSDIIERDQWGAEKAAGPYRQHEPEEIILHHSWIPAHKHYKEIKSVRGIQRYHMNSPYTGWDDIGYHYLIGPEGMVYRGRPENVVGAHCVPNSGKVGICIIGNHDEGEDPLYECTWREVENLVLQIAGRHDIPPENLRGHCDYSSKTCPGYVVYKRFGELRKKFESIGFCFDE